MRTILRSTLYNGLDFVNLADKTTWIKEEDGYYRTCFYGKISLIIYAQRKLSNALTIQEQLKIGAGIKLRLKINDNRSTMLSVKWEPDCTKVSLHRMFLQAPQNVMQALACYLRGEHKKIAPSIKAYIEDNLQKLDYSHQIDFSNCYRQKDMSMI